MNGIISQMAKRPKLILSSPQKEQLANLFTNLSSAFFISVAIPVFFGIDIPRLNAILLGVGAGIIFEIISLLILK